MSDYSEFFLNSKSSIVQLDLIELSHPSFSQTYYIVRNATQGVEVTLEDGRRQFFTYYPLRVSENETRDTLDYGMKITFGDLGEIIPDEVDRVSQDETFDTKPTVIYRTYRSDQLDRPMYGPIVLQAGSFSFEKQGATFEAGAPSLNINRTGETYSFSRFPMLRGFL